MPDLDDLQFNKPEDEIDYSDMSIDELLESTREELAHDDELMGETPEQKAPEEQPRAMRRRTAQRSRTKKRRPRVRVLRRGFGCCCMSAVCWLHPCFWRSARGSARTMCSH